jgi:hypothetical protein
MPDTLPAQIGCLGRHLVVLIQPWATCGRAVAGDSALSEAEGCCGLTVAYGTRKTANRALCRIRRLTPKPIGPSRAGIAVVAAVWIPLAADLTPANVADGKAVLSLMPELPDQTRFFLGDRHFNTPDVRAACQQQGLCLVATRYGAYPHTDIGVEVRRIFHKLRSLTIENFNQHFKGIFDAHGQVPTKGSTNTKRFALGAIFVYQLALLYRFEHGLSLNVGLKPFLNSA